MEAVVTSHELVDQVKKAALDAINELVAHHIKGADVLQKGLEQVCEFTKEAADWYDILKNLIAALKPFFGMVEEWLKNAYAHLVEIFNWAKEMWHKIFG